MATKQEQVIPLIDFDTSIFAEPYERRYTESRLMERLRESVLEMVHWQDCDSTWFFSIGCLLGELSGQLFPINDQEQKDYIQQYQWLGE